MTSGQTIRTVIELLVALSIIYGFIKEDKLIKFEDRIIKRCKCAKKIEQEKTNGIRLPHPKHH